MPEKGIYILINPHLRIARFSQLFDALQHTVSVVGK